MQKYELYFNPPNKIDKTLLIFDIFNISTVSDVLNRSRVVLPTKCKRVRESHDPRTPLFHPSFALPFHLFTFLPLKRSSSHAAGRSDRRQECRERSYYHLHRQLNQSLLLHDLISFLLFCHTDLTDPTDIFLQAKDLTDSTPCNYLTDRCS